MSAYVLGMFPYPSGTPHLGHVRVYTISDAVARHARAHGREVLHPMGWDAFGLPAENAAIARGVDPAAWTAANVAQMRDTFRRMGWSFDWDREIDTSSPAYHRWTQWLFLQWWDAGLVYRDAGWVAYCPGCRTVLAAEQVLDGACWRCSAQVERRRIPQWTVRITAYAQRLWDDLDRLTRWDPRAVAIQRHWIGRAEGIAVLFETEHGPIEAFVPGADEEVAGIGEVWLAPEHPVAEAIDPAAAAEGVRRSAVDRASTPARVRVDTGLRVGAQRLPVWIVDSVVPERGSAAILVPGGSATVRGERAVRFHLRDWSVGRQRRWGCPIPVVDCDRCGPVPIRAPVSLDDPPTRPCPSCGAPARRETDTLDTFVCSSWYAFRFTDPRRDDAPFAREAADRWMPVHTYVGGLDHAAQHMLYFRFVTKFLRDRGFVGFDEPVDRFVCNGMVLGGDGRKMSKSSGSGVDPAEILRDHSADAVRLAILADAPVERDAPWTTARLGSKEDFLKRLGIRVDAVLAGGPPGDPADWPDAALVERVADRIAALDRDLAAVSMHNAVARLHELFAALSPALSDPSPAPAAARALVRDALIAAAPLIPAFVSARWTGELRWPSDARAARHRVAVVVQVDGRTLGTIDVAPGASEDALRAAATARFGARVPSGPRRVVVVPDRLVNLVTR